MKAMKTYIRPEVKVKAIENTAIMAASDSLSIDPNSSANPSEADSKQFIWNLDEAQEEYETTSDF